MNDNNVLAQVIEALRDKGQRVLVETTYASQKASDNSATQDGPQIPTEFGQQKNGTMTNNRAYARSIKIGKISIRKMGNKYIVRTPEAESEFTSNDMFLIWTAALVKYDNPNDTDRILEMLKTNLRDSNLRAIASKGAVEADKKAAYKNATAQIESLGVKEQPHLAKYIQSKVLEKK